MSVITWGKPSIYVRDLSVATNNWNKLDTPKEDTTQLNAIAVQPEDAENPGCYIGKSTVSVEESYSSADGALMQYTHKALVPEGDEVAKTTNSKGETVYCQFRWRIITAKKAKGKTDEYVLTFKHPAGATDTETEVTVPTNGQVEGEP